MKYYSRTEYLHDHHRTFLFTFIASDKKEHCMIFLDIIYILNLYEKYNYYILIDYLNRRNNVLKRKTDNIF